MQGCLSILDLRKKGVVLANITFAIIDTMQQKEILIMREYKYVNDFASDTVIDTPE